MKAVYFALTLYWVLGLSPMIIAETATRIPVTVNVVEGCDVSDEEINAVVAEANKIMKPYMISYEISPQRINRNVAGAGSDGKISTGQEHGLVTGAMNEIKNTDGTYKGMKVFYGNELRNPNYYGMAYHADNGGHWYSVPVVWMKKRPGTAPADYKEKGNDLAHELAHSLTLVGAKPLSGAHDPNSDRWGHMTNPIDSDNLMYRYNGGTWPYRVERGGKLAPEQIKEIKENAKRFGKSVIVTPSQEYLRAMHPFHEPILWDPKPMMWVDDPAETYILELFYDLAFGYLYAESMVAGLLDIVINLAGAFPPSQMVNVEIWIFLDTDDDPGTGMPPEGFDKRIRVELTGQYPIVHTNARLENWDGVLVDYIPVAFFEQTQAICDTFDPDSPIGPQIEPFTDTLFLQLPIAWLDITASEIPIKISLQNLLGPDTDETSFIYQTQPINQPQMTLIDNSITPSEFIELTGSGYTPLEPVQIYLDDHLLEVTMADATGHFNAAIPYPVGRPFGRYFLSARDAFRDISDFNILTLFHHYGDINFDREVNLADLAILTQDWLSVAP